MNLSLAIKVARFERAASGGGDSQEMIKSLEAERAILKQEIVQLKETVASQRGVLQINDLSLKADEQSPRTVAYSMTVKRTVMDGSKLIGELNIVLTGTENGTTKQYGLEQLTEEGEKAHKLGFRSFQPINGVLQLPETFTPESMVIDIAVESGNLDPLREQYEWSGILAGASSSGT